MSEQHTPTSVVLNRAADLIEERGWARGIHSMTGSNGLCVMGALHLASTGRCAELWEDSAYDHVFACSAGRAVYDYLSLADTANAAWEWNDGLHFHTGGQQVVEVLRAAAAIEAARESAADGVTYVAEVTR